MKRFIPLLFVLFCTGCLGSLLSSCNDELHYSTNPADRLGFSSDTVSFDTIFTTIGSSTRILKVYNPNDKPIQIVSLTLRDPETSGFRINVDGQFGTRFSDLDVREKDSMYIFVEVTVNPQQRDNPIQIRDSLVFQLSNGTEQRVQLMAYGQDVIILRGKIIDNDTTLTAERPFLIYDSLRVNENSLLTLRAGTRLHFHDKVQMRIYGRLKAEGTLQAPVVFRGDRLDKMFDGLPYDRVPGQWGGVYFGKFSFENELNYVDIHGGNFGIKCDTSFTDITKLRLSNSVIHNVKGDGLSLIFCKSFIANSQITNALNNCVYILGGESDFVHCTIANHYNWDIRKGKSLYFSNVSDSVVFPLKRASFKNCLITGSGEDDLQGVHADSVQFPLADNFAYEFTHCVINSKDEGKPGFINVKWETKEEKNKDFLYIGKTDYEYDFRLDSVSPAVNYGRRDDALAYPLDRQGRSRLSDEAPDAGCYEWMPGDIRRE